MTIVHEESVLTTRTRLVWSVTVVSLSMAMIFCSIARVAAFADDLEAVKTAFEDGRYEEALPALRELAEQGRGDAQYLLAVAYRDGLGVPEDPEIATTWFRRCAETGRTPCQYELGVAFLNGRGVDISRDESRKWLEKAAAAGHPEASAALASIYLSEGNAAKARHSLRNASDAGNMAAAVELGKLLENGIGGPADRAAAADLYRSAGQQGEPEGVYRWALLEADGPEARAEVMRLSAEAGFATAQYELAASLLTADDVEGHLEGVRWLEAAARSGMARAQFDLAIVYRDGVGVEPDDLQFRTWLVEASDGGFPNAQYELAVALTDALHGFEEDYDRAYVLYSEAASRGLVEAEYGLGFLLSHGHGVPQDFALAAEHFRTAAEAGHVPSQVALGNLYANGQGVIESRSLAEKWYCMAARAGDEKATGFLGGHDKLDEACAVHENRAATSPIP